MTKDKIDPLYLSDCHHAPVRLVGGVGDFSDHEAARTYGWWGSFLHYECTFDEQPCDVVAKDSKQRYSAQSQAEGLAQGLQAKDSKPTDSPIKYSAKISKNYKVLALDAEAIELLENYEAAFSLQVSDTVTDALALSKKIYGLYVSQVKGGK